VRAAAFVPGADLSDFDFTPGPNLVERADPGPVIDQAFNPSTRRLQTLRMPTICAVNGVAAGAGASVVMACDIAIAAPAASFIQAFSKIGLIPDAGGSWLLVERLGLAARHGAGHDGRQTHGRKSQGVGHDLGGGRRLRGRALALAERLANMPTKALVATRLAASMLAPARWTRT
jgi:2-(1,2-epoxy-1,2-dihydrophenyl)acetyl-CoA isomerase